MKKYKKIKDLRRTGNRQKKNKNQIIASKKSGIIRMTLDNPMKNPKIVKKHIAIRKRRGTLKTNFPPFGKGNTFGKKNKGKHHKEETKLIIKIKNTGRKSSEKHKAIAREQMIKDNPMKKPKFLNNYWSLDQTSSK